MAEPFLSEIRIMSFGFAPKGWALCNVQRMPINQNQALFALLGTAVGGDGRIYFALPDRRVRTPIHVGCGRHVEAVCVPERCVGRGVGLSTTAGAPTP
jgi:microcystin-dependent protein